MLRWDSLRFQLYRKPTSLKNSPTSSACIRHGRKKDTTAIPSTVPRRNPPLLAGTIRNKVSRSTAQAVATPRRVPQRRRITSPHAPLSFSEMQATHRHLELDTTSPAPHNSQFVIRQSQARLGSFGVARSKITAELRPAGAFDFARSRLSRLPSGARPDGRGRPSPREQCLKEDFLSSGWAKIPSMLRTCSRGRPSLRGHSPKEGFHSLRRRKRPCIIRTGS